MKKLIMIGSLLVMAMSAFAHSDGSEVTNAKVGELSAHRVDRLVALGKIDASFLKQLEKIEVIAVEDQAPVSYKARVSQSQPAQGAPIQLDIFFNEEGKPLSFEVVAGGLAGPDMGWSDKDGGALAESALHYILDNRTVSKISPFDKGLSSLTVSKGILNGEAVALGQATSTLTKDKLNIYLKLNGSFISVEVIP